MQTQEISSESIYKTINIKHDFVLVFSRLFQQIVYLLHPQPAPALHPETFEYKGQRAIAPTAHVVPASLIHSDCGNTVYNAFY